MAEKMRNPHQRKENEKKQQKQKKTTPVVGKRLINKE
jgi:hypothetical protein